MDQNTSNDLVTNYVCARCWHDLTASRRPDGSFNPPTCSNPDCNGEGYVTRAFADRRRKENAMELANARINLRNVIPGLKSERTEAQILKELGF